MNLILKSVTVEQELAETTRNDGSVRTFISGLWMARVEYVMSGEIASAQTAPGVDLQGVISELRSILTKLSTP